MPERGGPDRRARRHSGRLRRLLCRLLDLRRPVRPLPRGLLTRASHIAGPAPAEPSSPPSSPPPRPAPAPKSSGASSAGGQTRTRLLPPLAPRRNSRRLGAGPCPAVTMLGSPARAANSARRRRPLFPLFGPFGRQRIRHQTPCLLRSTRVPTDGTTGFSGRVNCHSIGKQKNTENFPLEACQTTTGCVMLATTPPQMGMEPKSSTIISENRINGTIK